MLRVFVFYHPKTIFKMAIKAMTIMISAQPALPLSPRTPWSSNALQPSGSKSPLSIQSPQMAAVSSSAKECFPYFLTAPSNSCMLILPPNDENSIAQVWGENVEMDICGYPLAKGNPCTEPAKPIYRVYGEIVCASGCALCRRQLASASFGLALA